MYMNGELGISEHERDVLVTGNPLSSWIPMTILSVKVKNSRNMYIEQYFHMESRNKANDERMQSG